VNQKAGPASVQSFTLWQQATIAVLPQASLQKSLDSQKNSLDLKKNFDFKFLH